MVSAVLCGRTCRKRGMYMIEIIQQTEKNAEGKLPKNIRQIGNPEKGKFWNLCKAGSNHVYHISGCAVVL